MASIVEKFQKMWNPTDEEFDDYYDEDEYMEDEGDYQEDTKSYREENSGPSLFKRNNKVLNMSGKSQLKVIVYRPISYGQDTRIMAQSLMEGNAVVLNFEHTHIDETKRILDFLSGVALAKNGKISKISSSTFMITPEHIDLSGDDLIDEFENSGVYF